MWIPTAPHPPSALFPRQEPSNQDTDTDNKGDNDNNDGNKGPDWRVFTVVAIMVVLFIIIVVGIYAKLRKLRAKSPRPPKLLPGNFLKRKWQQWNPRAKGNYSAQLQENDGPTRRHRANSSLAREMEGLDTSAAPANETSAAAAAVNRNTSIRSVMTLPAYSPAVRENERILGREGDRAGIDVVVEFPETMEEEEEVRDQEMESLYQIRVARRQEQAEREDRRRRRREARQRGDLETLAQLRRESRQRQEMGGGLSAALIAEHQHAQANRDRRVSSVQYAELGVARHDGTRVRANSAESDHRPLLDSAASIGGSLPGGAASNRVMHHRDYSATSVLSAGSDDFGNAARNASTVSFETVPLGHDRSASGSRLTLATTNGSDLGDARIPQPEPPNYDELGWEEAPPYTSPVETRTTPQLPNIQRLPSIHITTSVTPVEEHPPQRIDEIDNDNHQSKVGGST
ncbi:uncharacterized protein BKCO1_90008 [Diplodia corticola]|uniref:Uncharacterized protein n=1 Tax=Diplodia corticola TaxID=236234 RepID=A0A1J9SAK3_9PEZI|nr:uncharacterized protein BKCO1_90008 [Diplodia corticola]OJD36908.1 hypothetical protein BKCO1_90008 [Diplodia corticola]